MNKRKIIVGLIGIVIVAVAFYLSGVFASMAEPPKKTVAPPAKKFVKTAPVVYDNVKTEIIAYGRVRTAQSLDMIAEISGRMMQGAVPLKEGQRFSKGTLLFKIDDEEARLTLQSQKSIFLRDLASILPDLKIDFADSYEKWSAYFQRIEIDKDLPELPDYSSEKEKTFLATRNILSSYYTIKSQESRLKKYRFYAPFGGSIYTVNLQSGSFVNPGNVIGRLIRSDELELKVDVDAREIGWIEKGSETMIYAENGDSWVGTVTRVGEFVNQNTQSIDVFISIKENGKPIYDGQFLKSVIPSRNIPNSMLIPRSAIFNQNEVFVVNDTLLEVRKITLHKINEETAVMSGLNPGEDMVTEPLVNAYNGMTVYKIEGDRRDINMEAQPTIPQDSAPAAQK